MTTTPQPRSVPQVSKCGSFRGRPGQVHAHEIRCHRCARAYAGRYSGR